MLGLGYLCSALSLLEEGGRYPEVCLLHLIGDLAQDLNPEETSIQEPTMEKGRTSFLWSSSYRVQFPKALVQMVAAYSNGRIKCRQCF